MTKLLIALALLLPAAAAAQPGAAALERVRAAHEAFLIQELELTEAEQAAFLPIFWKYEEQLRAVRDDAPLRRRAEPPATDAEARRRITERYERLQRALDVRRAADEAYLKVLPARKVLRLPAVEADFRRELRSRVRDRIRERRGDAGRRFRP